MRRFGSGRPTSSGYGFGFAFAVALALGACGVDDGGAEDRGPDGPSSEDAGATADAAREAAASDASAGEQPPASPVDAGDDADADSPEEYSGEATYYDAEGRGSCGIPFPPDYLLAAMNGAQYQKPYCGECVSVTGPKGSVVVRILDLCPGCKSGGLDLSITAFTKIADKTAGRVPITWHFVDCPF